MVEPMGVEDGPLYKGARPSTTRTSIFNVYLILSSLCAIARLIIAAFSLNTANELEAFKSSYFITDLERTFNSTMYAIANSDPNSLACDDLVAESVTSQTSIPGQCVTVLESYNMWVTRLAHNYAPYAYAQQNCTGTQRKIGSISAPSCVVVASAGDLGGDSGDFFKSF